MQSRLMSFASGAQPHLPADFVIANEFANSRMENLRAAARAGIHSGGLHFLQRFFDGQVGDAREIMDFHHGESFQVYVRAALLQPAN